MPKEQSFLKKIVYPWRVWQLYFLRKDRYRAARNSQPEVRSQLLLEFMNEMERVRTSPATVELIKRGAGAVE